VTPAAIGRLLSDHGWHLTQYSDTNGVHEAWYEEWPAIRAGGETAQAARQELNERVGFALMVAGIRAIELHALA
jgi:hypothetical protein